VIGGINADMEMPMVARQVKSLNNIEVLDHRAVKRITKPMLGFKSFQSAKSILAGIELMHMIRKGQLAQMICLLPTNFSFGRKNPPSTRYCDRTEVCRSLKRSLLTRLR